MKRTNFFELIRNGDKKAFDEMFLLYYKELCRFAIVFLHNRDDSEDVVQKLFVRLWEKRKYLTQPENTKSFLYKSIYNESLKHLKSNATREKCNLQFALQTRMEVNNIETTDLSSFLPHLKNAIDKLPTKCREIFVLHKIEGFTQKEISEILGISTKTIENQIAIAISKLRTELKPFLHLLSMFLM